MHFEIYPVPSNALSALASMLAGTEWRWRLRGDNGKTLASGESFNNKADCLHSIRLVMSTNSLTPIQETTN